MTWTTLNVAKTYLRVDGNDEDALIPILLDAAQSQVESYTGLCLFTQTVTKTFSHWRDLARLPIGPVISVSQITYIDRDGALQTLDPSIYRTSIHGLASAIVLLKPFPRVAHDITVTMSVGFGTTTPTIPAAIIQALYLTLGDFYAFREDTVAERSVTPQALPNGVATLLTNWRVI